MTVYPADGLVYGAVFGSDAMRTIMEERAYLARMLDVEAALARAQARLGLIPAEAAKSITDAAQVDRLDMAALAKATANMGFHIQHAREVGALLHDRAHRVGAEDGTVDKAVGGMDGHGLGSGRSL